MAKEISDQELEGMRFYYYGHGAESLWNATLSAALRELQQRREAQKPLEEAVAAMQAYRDLERSAEVLTVKNKMERALSTVRYKLGMIAGE